MKSNSLKRVAIVTGASRGLGLAVATQLAERNYRVVFACRNPEKLDEKLNELIKKDLNVSTIKLDVSKSESIEVFYTEFKKRIGHCDVLVNNAGIFIDNEDGGHQDLYKTKRSTIEKTFATNTIGPFLLIQKFLPDMIAENYGRIVNVSSGMGQLQDMESNYAAYRISKTALNSITTMIAATTRNSDVLINSVCPGWVRTDMGGGSATRSIEQGSKGIVWAATLPKGGPSGGFFRDGQSLAW